MLVLGIDTATSTASVGLLDGDRPLAERQLPGARSLAATVVPLIQEVLSDANRRLDALDLIAVSTGPGSFTGLRIGLSVAKGLALSLRRSVVGVSTLEALAHVALAPGAGPTGASAAADDGTSERPDIICTVLDARRGEVYGALFRTDADLRIERLTADFATEPQFLAAELAGVGEDRACIMIGDGAEAYRSVWQQAIAGRLEILPFAEFGPRGAVVAELGRRKFIEHGGDSIESVVPSYCRVADAERKAARAAALAEYIQRTGDSPP